MTISDGAKAPATLLRLTHPTERSHMTISDGAKAPTFDFSLLAFDFFSRLA